jgi:hypothetical protein
VQESRQLVHGDKATARVCAWASMGGAEGGGGEAHASSFYTYGYEYGWVNMVS